MNILKCFMPLSLVSVFSLCATAAVISPDIAIVSPNSGDEMVSPFLLLASAPTCLTRKVQAMAYSLDDDADHVVGGNALRSVVEATPGLHTVHIKAWGTNGAACFTDHGVAVTPSTAPYLGSIQRLGNWTWKSKGDPVIGGTATGVMSQVNFGFTRKFVTTYTNSGGELYSVSFKGDPLTKNFMYDAWILFAAPSTGIGNLELDFNQVTANGQTVIFGFQCDGYSGTWDYTTNTGTPQKYVDRWIHSAAHCNPQEWSTNIWHHVQVNYSRDDAGNVTYSDVALDGVVSHIGATVPSSFALGWAKVLITNFQVDGIGKSGSSTTYLNDLTIYGW
jgi:hypothetical protein